MTWPGILSAGRPVRRWEAILRAIRAAAGPDHHDVRPAAGIAEAGERVSLWQIGERARLSSTSSVAYQLGQPRQLSPRTSAMTRRN
ncbi:hypothetical protein [Streptomyces sp. TE33382]